MAQQLTELQEKWLQALESGKYRQAEGALKVGRKYCCLGVACRVAGKRFDKNGNCLGRDTDLPKEVSDAIGFRGDEGDVLKPFKIGDSQPFQRLTSANDTGITFKEIAAAIRANPENFFLPPEAQS